MTLRTLVVLPWLALLSACPTVSKNDGGSTPGLDGSVVDSCAVCSPNAACAKSATTVTCSCNPGYRGDGKTCDAIPTAVTLNVYNGNALNMAPVTNAWVVYQDGDGLWQALEGLDGGYTFNVTDPQGRYGLAIQCPDSTQVQVSLATVLERPSIHQGCIRTAILFINHPVTVQTEDWPAGTFFTRTFLGPRSLDEAGQNGHTLNVIEGASEDALSLAMDDAGTWTHGVLKRNIGVAQGNSYAFDFSADGFTAASFNFAFDAGTYLLVDGGTQAALPVAAGWTHNFVSAGEQPFPLPPPVPGLAKPLNGVPAAALVDGDRDVVVVEHLRAADAGTLVPVVLSALSVTHAVSDVVLGHPAEDLTSFSASQRASSSGLLPKISWGGAFQDASALLMFQQGSNVWYVGVSPSRQDGGSVELPDLSAAPQANPAVLLRADAGVSVALELISAAQAPGEVMDALTSTASPNIVLSSPDYRVLKSEQTVHIYAPIANLPALSP